MTKLIRLINTTIISSLLFATSSSHLAASKSAEVDTVESESTAVTTLEVIPITPIAILNHSDKFVGVVPRVPTPYLSG